MEPRISVVIPVRDRPAEIEACIRSLQALDYPSARLEIIVVDDASSDETTDVVRAITPPVRLLAQSEHRGQSECRNIGARAASGDIVAFIDSDCEADPGWLRGLVDALDRAGAVASGGSVRESRAVTWLERYESVSSPLNLGNVPARVVPGTRVDFLPSCNLAVRRDVFLAVGAFDARLRYGEDVDLVWRLCERGEVRYRPEAVVWHRHRGRLGPFLATRRKYAAAQAVFLKRHPANRRRLDVPAGLAAAGFAAIGGFLWPVAWLVAIAVPAFELSVTLAVAGAAGVARAVRGYASSAYRALSFVAGIYSVPLTTGSLVAAAFWRPAVWMAAAVMASLVLTAFAEWARSRPPLDLVRFTAAFVLDRAVQSFGILTGCVTESTAQPLSLRIRLHPSAARMPIMRDETERPEGARSL